MINTDRRVPMDPVALTQKLVQCVSVTPADDGALDLVEQTVREIGFETYRLDFNGTPNLFARRGVGGRHLCFAGHTDVVPAGHGSWDVYPFSGEIRDGAVWGRGSSDMKGAIAAFICALSTLDQNEQTGSISLLITGDEEGPATDGTARVLEWMATNDHLPDFCIVGEATNPEQIGEVIKIGRRGSINSAIEVRGVQGHVAYPNLVMNPVTQLVKVLSDLASAELDAGNEWFEPSTLQITTIDVGNETTNIVPAVATAKLNIRFNNLHSGASLGAWIQETVSKNCRDASVENVISGESFISQPGALLSKMVSAIEAELGTSPRFDTSGGTSDARFISRYCEVAEFGLTSETIHKLNEKAKIQDLLRLSSAYRRIIYEFAFS